MTPQTANIKLRDIDGRREVFDIVRNRFVALTPEEWVRQNVIHYLHFELGYPLELLQVEGTITLNGMTLRCDIVVYDSEVRPLVIVECKRETVPLTQKVIDQACRYNLVLHVPYLCLTNGPNQICCKVDFEQKRLMQIPKIPNYCKKS
jgi:hypothetical protein